MFGDGESGAVEVLYSMAILATILVGRGGKLFVMSILVTIRTDREFHMVYRVLTGWGVAFIASDCRMFALEGIA